MILKEQAGCQNLLHGRRLPAVPDAFLQRPAPVALGAFVAGR